MSETKIIGFYKDLIRSLDLEVNNDNQICCLGNPDPITVDINNKNHTLYLPVRDALALDTKCNPIFLHPLSENQFLQRSVVFDMIVKLVKAKMVVQSMLLLSECLEICAEIDSGSHTPSMDQLGEFQNCKVTRKDIDNFHRKILSKLGENPDLVLGIKITRDGKYNGDEYKRVSRLVPTLLKEIKDAFEDYGVDKAGNKKPKPHFLGIKAPNLRSIPDLSFMIHLIFENTIVGTSDSANAPYLESLLDMFKKFALHTNKLVKLVSQNRKLVETNLKPIDVGYIDLLRNYDDLISDSQIPAVLEYNEGKGDANNKPKPVAGSGFKVEAPSFKATVSEPKPQPVQEPVAPVNSNPQYTPDGQYIPTKEEQEAGCFMPRNYGQPQQQSLYMQQQMQQPMMNGYQQQPTGGFNVTMNPQMQQTQQMQQPMNGFQQQPMMGGFQQPQQPMGGFNVTMQPQQQQPTNDMSGPAAFYQAQANLNMMSSGAF